MAVGTHLALPGFRDVIGDVGRQRRFAHTGASRDDNQIGGLQAAHLKIEIDQPGGEARKLAVALIGTRRQVDRGSERLRKALETAVITSSLRDLEELALGILD